MPKMTKVNQLAVQSPEIEIAEEQIRRCQFDCLVQTFIHSGQSLVQNYIQMHRPLIHCVDIVVFCLSWGVVGLPSVQCLRHPCPDPSMVAKLVPTEWIEELCRPAHS